ncbi:hypothetical protein [Massilia sp. YMA4]|nr:hypothetical protein [Massilia sp. YMA4]
MRPFPTPVPTPVRHAAILVRLGKPIVPSPVGAGRLARRRAAR